MLAVLAIGLAGCNRGDLKQDLVAPASRTQIVLQNDVSYTTVRGIGVTWVEGLKSGVYVSEFENEHGIFYRGSGKCVTDKGGMAISQFEGGVWLPKESYEKPKLYYYFDFDSDTVLKGGGPVIYGIVAAGKGDLTFVPGSVEDPAILSRLTPVPIDTAVVQSAIPVR